MNATSPSGSRATPVGTRGSLDFMHAGNRSMEDIVSIFAYFPAARGERQALLFSTGFLVLRK